MPLTRGTLCIKQQLLPKMMGIYPSARLSPHSHSHNENVGYRAPCFCLDTHDVHTAVIPARRSFYIFLPTSFLPRASSSPALLLVPLFFYPRACIHRQPPPLPPLLLDFLRKAGLYGHETRPGKRHVSESGNENVADATRFRRWSTRADRCILLLRYPHGANHPDRECRPRSTSFK